MTDTNEPPVSESIDGYLIDQACLGEISPETAFEAAKAYTKSRALSREAIESGYAVVQENGWVVCLEKHATPSVLQVIQESSKERGIEVHVERGRENGDLHTLEVKAAA